MSPPLEKGGRGDFGSVCGHGRWPAWQRQFVEMAPAGVQLVDERARVVGLPEQQFEGAGQEGFGAITAPEGNQAVHALQDQGETFPFGVAAEVGVENVVDDMG